MPRFRTHLTAIALIALSQAALAEDQVKPPPYYGTRCDIPNFPGSAGLKPKHMSMSDELREKERQTKEPFTLLEQPGLRLLLIPWREMHGVVRGHPNGDEQKIIIKFLKIENRCGRFDGRLIWPDLRDGPTLPTTTVIKGVIGNDAFVFQEIEYPFTGNPILKCRYRFEPAEPGQLKGPVSCPDAIGEAILSDVDYLPREWR